MRIGTLPVILALLFTTACAGAASSTLTGSRMLVDGTGPEEFLKMRAGPGMGYSVILGLPEGTSLIRSDCVTEVGQSWCRVALAAAPQITGYVSADYISAY